MPDQPVMSLRNRRVLGLDPGLQATGWGVIDLNGSRIVHVASGTVRSGADRATAVRLHQIFEALLNVITRYGPVEAAVEETFVNKNPATTLKLGLARGAVLLAPASVGLPVAEYAAKHVKKALVGTGSAEKGQVEAMVRRLLPGADPAGADAADALAVAICHAHHGQTRQALAVAKSATGVAQGGER